MSGELVILALSQFELRKYSFACVLRLHNDILLSFFFML